MRKICKLCKSTISSELSEKCSQCENKKDCPLLADSPLCEKCRSKIGTREDSDELRRMFNNLSNEDRMALSHEIKTLSISMMAGKMMDVISDMMSGKDESSLEDLFESMTKKPKKESGDILPKLFSMGRPDFGKIPPFMCN